MSFKTSWNVGKHIGLTLILAFIEFFKKMEKIRLTSRKMRIRLRLVGLFRLWYIFGIPKIIIDFFIIIEESLF